MPPFKDSMENPGQSRSPGLAAHLGGQFTAGLIILAVLGFVLSLLQRLAENTRKR